MKVIEIEGNADDLYCNDKDNSIKSVSVVKFPEDGDEFRNDLDITLTSFSVDDSNKHEVISKLLGHKIRFTVEIVD